MKPSSSRKLSAAHLVERLFTDGIQMSELLEHSEVVSNREVLYDLGVFQPESMNMLHKELLPSRKQGRSVQRRNLRKIAEVCTPQCDFAHNGVAFFDQSIDLKAQIWERTFATHRRHAE